VSITENKQIVLAFMDAMCDRDIDGLAAMATDDMVYRIMGTATISGERDKAGFVEVASGLSGMLDGKIAFDNVILTAEDDRVAAAFDGRGRLIDGRPYENTYHALFFLREGKVCRLHELFDTKYADELIGRLAAASQDHAG
jgi:uncharacterized protein